MDKLYKVMLVIGMVGALLASQTESDFSGAPSINSNLMKLENPVIDQGTWITKQSLPSPKYYHSVAVIGNKLYLTGGGEYTAPTTDCWEYDIATNTWTTKAAMPQARVRHASAGLQGKVYAIAGYNGSANINLVHVYDPVTNTWSSAANYPQACQFLTAETWNDQYIYGIGGQSTAYLNTVYYYDPTSNTWTQASSMPVATRSHGSGIIGNTLYVWAGYNGAFIQDFQIGQINPSNPAQITWTSGPQYPVQASRTTGDEVNDPSTGWILMGSCGNWTGTPAHHPYSYIYVPGSSSWTQIQDKPTVSDNADHGVGVNNVFYMPGGYDGSAASNVFEAYEFPQALAHDVGVFAIPSPSGNVMIGNPVDVIVTPKNYGQNQETFSLHVEIRDPSSAIVFSDDSLNITLPPGQTVDINFGQWTPTQFGTHTVKAWTTLAGDQNPANDTLSQQFNVSGWGSWTPYNPPGANYDRLTHATVYDPDNDKIYMIGGTPNGQSGSNVPYCYRYDPVTNSWNTNLANMPDARGWIQGGYWNGKIYIPGGYTNAGANSNTFYIYDIASNSWTQGPTLPEARLAYGLAVWNGNIYVIGGVNPGLNAGTQTVFRYNVSSNQWTQATQIPMQFDMGGSCYLGDTIYLVGGVNRGAGTAWTQVLRGIIDNQNPDNITWTWITNLPYANAINAACALPGKLYMIGGFINLQTATNRVWEYDIATNTWTELPQYVVPIVRNHFACTRPQIGGVGARIYVVAGDANGDWNPPNNYYYYLERAVGVSEKAYKERPYIFFINPNIGKGPFSIYFSLKNRSNVDISIYNTLGQKISDIYKGVKEAGNHVIRYDGNLNSGIYFIILKTSENSGSYRIIKVK